MILDGHIHIRDKNVNSAGFLKKLSSAKVTGGIIISLPPKAFPYVAPHLPSAERIENVLLWCESSETLYPFYWIDPMESDALAQVDMAADKGAAGFKIICGSYFPGDKTAMKVYAAIADTKLPILFHSGILWDGKPSSKYNRPAAFEELLTVKGLRFSLAHISWPWYDELLAVYGKFLNAHRTNPDSSSQMFIDTTPGTPRIYRKEALTKMFTIGYDIQNNVIFGSDSAVNQYNVKWVQEWIKLDKEIFKQLNLNTNIINDIFSENLRRFVGISPIKADKRPLKPGE
jgi:predicted TIM-barrel fold metal-dependent hydrolase